MNWANFRQLKEKYSIEEIKLMTWKIKRQFFFELPYLQKFDRLTILIDKHFYVSRFVCFLWKAKKVSKK